MTEQPAANKPTGGRGRGGRGRGRSGRGGGRGRGRGRGSNSNKKGNSTSDSKEPSNNDKNQSNIKPKNKKNSNKNNQSNSAKPPPPTSDAGNKKPAANNDNKKPKPKQNNPKKNKASNNNSSKSDTGLLAPSIPPNQPQQTSDINYGKNATITILHVAEKPSIAQAIAKGLSNNYNSRGGKALPVHECTTPFPKAPHAKQCKHKITSVVGHVFSVDFSSQFQSWDSVDPAELYHAPIIRKPCKGSVVKHLQDEARGVDFIVLWLDCDREGENINFEVLDVCMHLMKGSNPYDRVYRAHFSAINPSDIQKAYKSLGKPDKNQALAVDARQELDLKVGVSFSRFQVSKLLFPLVI